MAEDELHRCPTCGRPHEDALLDEVEETFDAFFEASANAPVRITLDGDSGGDRGPVTLPAAQLRQVEETLAGVAQALQLLESSLSAEDLRTLVRTLASESSRCAALVRDHLQK